MEKFLIRGLGGKKALKGTVKVNGAKNAALKAMAAAALFDGPVRLRNMPRTEDIAVMADIIRGLGAAVSWIEDDGDAGHAMEIDPRGIKSSSIDRDLAGKMRASVVLTGPLLGRSGRVMFPAPGGCVIGARPIGLFLDGYRKMGAAIREDGVYDIEAAAGGLEGANISFEKISVGATETLMMAAVLAGGKTVLENCAREPEIANVAEWLNACGAKIKGAGTPTVTIDGAKGKLLKPAADFTAIPDRIEAGSFLILGALCAEDMAVENCRPDHLEPVMGLLKRSGVPVEATASAVKIRGNSMPNSSFRAFDVTTGEYPGFATDLQPVISAYLTQVSGESAVKETIFEGRFKYVDDLKYLGADIRSIGADEIRIEGPTPLKALSDGRQLTVHDIRAGFAVVLAALCAEGNTTISDVHLIDRGYEKLEDRLRGLGANFSRSS